MQDTSQGGLRSKVRWVVAGLIWVVIAINYIDRTVLSAATPHTQKEFHLSATEVGVVMSASFWSYALLQLPAGILADRFGQKKVLGLAVLWWSIATALTGLVSGFKSLVDLRVALDVGETGAYSSSAGITGRWFPKQERATVAAILDSGSKLGGAVASPLIAWLLVMFDWKITFVVTGRLDVVWAVVWWVVFRGTPETHKGVNVAELTHVQRGLPPAHKDKPKVPWMKLFTHRNIWAMCIGFFMINYNSYFFITWLPTYLVKKRGMGLMQMGLMASLLLFVLMFVEVFAGWALDRVYASGELSLTITRKLFLIIGLVMASGTGLAALAQSAVVAVILLCAAKSGTAVTASQAWVLPADTAPGSNVSMVAGLQNSMSNIRGVVDPIVTGAIVGATGSFIPALVFSTALIGLAILNYLFLLGKMELISFEPTPETHHSHNQHNADARA